MPSLLSDLSRKNARYVVAFLVVLQFNTWVSGETQPNPGGISHFGISARIQSIVDAFGALADGTSAMLINSAGLSENNVQIPKMFRAVLFADTSVWNPQNFIAEDMMPAAKMILNNLGAGTEFSEHPTMAYSLYFRLKLISLSGENSLERCLRYLKNLIAQNYENLTAAPTIEKIKMELKNRKELRNVNFKDIDQLYFKAADLYLEGRYEDSKSFIAKIKMLDPSNEDAIKLEQKIYDIAQRLKANDSK